KTQEKFILVHWKYIDPEDTLRTSIAKYEGCSIGKKNDTNCLISKPISKWHQVVSKATRDETGIFTLKLPFSAYIDKYKLYLREELPIQNNIQIKILSLEEAIIQRVIEDKNVQKDLREIVEKLKGERVLNIYTDRLLASEEIGNNREKKMGIG
ncbi:7445_t:CDS:1, partial [Scutellospora calospora]